MEIHLKNKIKRMTETNKSVLHKIETESKLINDYLIPAENIGFELDGSQNIHMIAKDQNSISDFTMNKNAIHQIVGKESLPGQYIYKAIDSKKDWQMELIRDMLIRHTLYDQKGKTFLIREVNNEVRAFLSDSYRRYDSGLVYGTFITAAVGRGMEVIDAGYDGIKGYMEVVHPNVIEVETENNGTEYLAIGARIKNSDFGASALDLSIYIEKIICSNGMVGENILRNVHLGRKIDDIRLSNDTYRKESEYKAAFIRDAMNQYFTEDGLIKTISKIKDSSIKKLDNQEYDRQIVKLSKMGFYKAELETLDYKLKNNSFSDGLQGEMTLWKLSQGVTSVANETKDDMRRREIHEIGGKLIGLR